MRLLHLVQCARRDDPGKPRRTHGGCLHRAIHRLGPPSRPDAGPRRVSAGGHSPSTGRSQTRRGHAEGLGGGGADSHRTDSTVGEPSHDHQQAESSRGRAFENRVGKYLDREGFTVRHHHVIEISINGLQQKPHQFDWGNDRLSVECKAQSWPPGGNIPRAKLDTDNEAMLYFMAASTSNRKMLFMLETEGRNMKVQKR